ncbi:thioesterase family protein [Streptomyces sp. CA-132043]|uniref:thioesterase family protein n=1 Tax=Streptomyces sp. CA-132043 TaxID=3240048 RepID=UPI003D90E782
MDVVTTVGRDWWSWSSAHGGRLASLALGAARGAAGTGHTPRSLTVNFLSAVTDEPLLLRPVPVRVSRGASVITVESEHRGTRPLLATATFGAPREGREVEADAPAAAPEPDECKPLDFLDAHFAVLRNVEMRAVGPLPLSGAPEADLRAWVRYRDGRPLDAEAATVLTDVLPCGVYALADAVFAAPTVDMTLHYAPGAETPPASPWALCRIRTRRAANGWAVDDSEVRDAEGRLLVLGRQSRRLLERTTGQGGLERTGHDAPPPPVTNSPGAAGTVPTAPVTNSPGAAG